MATAAFKEMTARQAEVHGFMVEHQREHGMPPTVREIMQRFDWASPSGVQGHLKALIRKRWARASGQKTARGVVAVDPTKPDACPCCGRPIEEGGAV
jgi:SOS-response transcriptional repressor LexA